MLEKIEVFGISTGTNNGFNYGVTGVAYNSSSVNIAGGFYAEGGEVESPESIGVSARASVASSQGTNYGIRTSAFGALNNYGIYASVPAANENHKISRVILLEMFMWTSQVI